MLACTRTRAFSVCLFLTVELDELIVHCNLILIGTVCRTHKKRNAFFFCSVSHNAKSFFDRRAETKIIPAYGIRIIFYKRYELGRKESVRKVMRFSAQMQKG